MIGQPLLDRVHPDFHTLERERVRRINHEKAILPLSEQIYLRMDGTPVAVEVSAVPIRYDGKDGALVFMRDISARIAAEQERGQLQAQLYQAQKMESAGRLAGGVAHDFNNLLSIILGYGEIVMIPGEHRIETPPVPKQPEIMTESATVLVVEDDLTVRKLACTMLSRSGFQVIESEDAFDAIRLAHESRCAIDLVLTDVVMPEMKGPEVFARIQEAHPAARVLFMSGYTDDIIAHRGVLDHGQQFLQKPFSMQVLITKIRDVLYP